MRKLRVIEQSEHSECGLACAAILLSMYDPTIRLSYLRDRYGVPNGGFNMYQISEILKENGISNVGVRISNLRSMKSSFLPFLAHLNRGHFIVIEKISGNNVWIIDPSTGREKVSVFDLNEKLSGVGLIINKEESVYTPVFSFRKEKSIFEGLNLKLLIGILTLSIFIQLLSLYLPNLIKNLMDNNIQEISSVVFEVIIAIIVYYLFSALRLIIVTKFQILFDKYLMKRILTHLLSVPMTFFTNRSRGEIIFRINSSTYIRQVISESLTNIVVDILFVGVYLYVLLNINVSLTFFLLFICFVLIAIIVLFTIKYKSVQENQIITASNTQGKVTEIINNLGLIKTFGVEKFKYSEWEKLFEEQMKMEEKKAIYTAFLGNVRNLFPIFLPFLIYLFGSVVLKTGVLTIGELILFNTVASLMATPIISFVTLFNSFSIVKIYIQKMFELISSEKQKYGNVQYENKQANLKIKNLYFSYDYFSDWVLKDINLNIKEGEKVAIVGPSGSGKSTLLKLILRFIELSLGEIQISGVDIKEFSKEALNSIVGAMHQDTELIQGTVEDNITMYDNTHNRDYLSRIYAIVGLNNSTKGISSQMMVSEFGKNLSGGEKQRIGIARVLYKKPKIMLYDEPTSSLDNLSERKIMNYLLQLKETCIIIAHRFYEIEKFDRIIVLDKGVIVGDGRHIDLIESCEIYRQLYEKCDY